MASRRQKKKQAQRKQIQNLQRIGKERGIQVKVKGNQGKQLRTLENKVLISKQTQNAAAKATQMALPREIAQTQMPDSARAYTAIKKYHEYIDKGIIQEQSILDKYQIQDFMERIMDEEEYNEYIEESIQKGEDLLRKDAERRLKHQAEWSNYSF